MNAYELPDGEYWRYLRKSRQDIEAEDRGEGETLAKHRRALDRLGKSHNILITESFEEIESGGESLYFRTEMLRMLDLMETRRPKGILVMDIDRFGRGNMQEQGLILDAFRRLNILIITPRKVYDLNDEFDEEYSEFEAFMARKELKIINRRLQGGRLRSIEEGNYVGTRPPYGYSLGTDEKESRILVPNPDQAEVVRLIFDWYVNGIVIDGKLEDMGAIKIAKRLEEMNVPTYRLSTKWNFNVILQILRNAVYIGRIQWKKQERRKTRNIEKAYDYKKRDAAEIIDVKGKHDPIVSDDLFHKAQVKLNESWSAPVKENAKLINPLAGIVICEMCGSSMIFKRQTRNRELTFLICNNRYCTNRSARFDFIENRLLLALDDWLASLKIAWGSRAKKETSGTVKIREQALKSLQQELEQLQQQKTNLHDLLERKIYDEETFLARSQALAARIKESKDRITVSQTELEIERTREKNQKDIIPSVQDALKLYRKTNDVAAKNKIMKSIVTRVLYRKEKHQHGDDFQLQVEPRQER